MDEDEKEATYHPQLQWKPRHRIRDPKKRRQLQRYRRRNRAKLRRQQKMRYKKLKNNPMYKKLRSKRRHETKRRLYMASRVASAWVVATQWRMKVAFNNLREKDLTYHGVKDLPKPFKPHFFDQMLLKVARKYHVEYDPVKSMFDFGVTDLESDAPSKMLVLYRFLKRSDLFRLTRGQADDPVVVFDVYVYSTGQQDPRGHRLTKRFIGGYDDLARPYYDFMMHIHKVLHEVEKSRKKWD